MIKYLSIGHHINIDLILPIKNNPLSATPKPYGGLWLSTYTPNEDYLSEWDMASTDMFGSNIDKQCSLITLKHSARIYTINTHADLTPFVEKYKLVEEDPTLQSILSTLQFATIDFEAVCNDYDCIHLTSIGQCNTRFAWGENERYSLYGWDSETLLILNKECIDTIELTNYKTLKKTR